MAISEGTEIPYAMFVTMGSTGPEAQSTEEVFGGKSVALFGIPGAYTPVCHKAHVPGILALHDSLKQNGIDTIACTAVNDIFVLNRWSEELGAAGKILMLADGNGDFAVKTGLAVDMTKYGLGVRSNRYAMLAKNGTVNLLSIEDVVMNHDKSSAATVCDFMGASV